MIIFHIKIALNASIEVKDTAAQTIGRNNCMKTKRLGFPYTIGKNKNGI